MARTPKNTIKINRLPGEASKLPEVGAKLPLTVEVTRVGRNSFDTADTVTIRIPGFGTPVTINAEYLIGDD